MDESDSGERLRAYLSLSVRAFASTAEDWANSSLWSFSSLDTVSAVDRRERAKRGRERPYRSFKIHCSRILGVNFSQSTTLTTTPKLLANGYGQHNDSCFTHLTIGYSHSGSWISATVSFINSSTEYVLVDDMIVEQGIIEWMSRSKVFIEGFCEVLDEAGI